MQLKYLDDAVGWFKELTKVRKAIAMVEDHYRQEIDIEIVCRAQHGAIGNTVDAMVTKDKLLELLRHEEDNCKIRLIGIGVTL